MLQLGYMDQIFKLRRGESMKAYFMKAVSFFFGWDHFDIWLVQRVINQISKWSKSNLTWQSREFRMNNDLTVEFNRFVELELDGWTIRLSPAIKGH